MDERSDAYFALGQADRDHLHQLIAHGQALAEDEQLRAVLGIDSEPFEIVQARCASPERSLLDELPSGAASFLGVLKLAALVRHTRFLLRSQPLEEVLSRVAQMSSRGTRDRPDRAIVEARRFSDARRFVPAQRNCLVDSLSLLRWLAPVPSETVLVFGVKLNPFAAHCWIQSEDQLLNDHVEKVAAFAPVRVMRCLGDTH